MHGDFNVSLIICEWQVHGQILTPAWGPRIVWVITRIRRLLPQICHPRRRRLIAILDTVHDVSLHITHITSVLSISGQVDLLLGII